MRLRTRFRFPTWWLVAVAIPAACGDSSTEAAPSFEPIDLSRPWVAAAPADVGFDADRLDQAFDDAARLPNLRALLVVRDGRLVREAYFDGTDAETLLDVRSVTKTVTALLVAIAVDDGLLDVDDPIGRWFAPDSLRPAHDAIRIRHLLTMTSGIRWTDADDFVPWWLSGRPVGYVLDLPVIAPPGERFMYNTGGSHLLAQIVTAATGESLLSWADRRLFGPLGITERAWLEVAGQASGGAGLALRARDLARLGQLVLQDGWSGGRSVVSAGRIAEGFARGFPVGPVGEVLVDGAYGYQVWVDGSPPEAFVMWGYGGQFVWVVPARNLLVVGAHAWSGIGYDGSARQANALGALIREQVIPAAR